VAWDPRRCNWPSDAGLLSRQLPEKRSLKKDLTLIGCTARDQPVFPNLVSYIEKGEIKLLLAKTFPLEKIVEAQREFTEKKHLGKYVLIPLFPVSIVVFLAIGVWASRIYLDFFSHVLHHGSFNHTVNNSLSQLLPSFAFAMVGVGLAAPAAMSHNDLIIGVSYLLSLFFTTGALFLGMIKLVIGMDDMLKQGVSRASLPTIWVVIPILTTAGIAVMRLSHGLHKLELGHGASNYILLSIIFLIQIIFFLLGCAVMRRMHYFHKLLIHEETAPVTLALICPGVAFVVMGHFVLNKVFMESGIIAEFGVVYIVLSFALIVLQFLTGWLLFRLAKAQFKSVN
jgi:hypothetical protein